MSILPPETRPDGLVWEAGPIGPGWHWVHYDLVHSAARPAIEAMDSLPEDARDTLVAADETLRLESEGHTVFGVLPGLEGRLGEDGFAVAAWRFAVSPASLVTSRRAPVSTLGEAYRRIGDGGMDTPAALIDYAVTSFTIEVRKAVARLALDLDDAEDHLLKEAAGVPDGVGSIIGRVRRHATRLKRVMAPLDRVFHSDTELPDWEIQTVYERLQREIHNVADDLFALQDRSRSLQDELSSRQAEEANERLYLVSIVTALMLPATFVTGFFGMNTGGMFLAGTHGHGGTIMAGVICLLSLIGMFGFLKFRKLL
ncbi:CorA family divalent cation transporter [Lichenicoccus roseus]|uniref:Magnesium transporter n=1 Tax=Lichenicoccus roseus TaxID=2683649 RepID=A0A5R9J757_9PROT|nr:CorA family divalent cation transporter [Lichenicoccus roseus]TLU71451.1 magnesium transporter [Lichenicoccus roseus]